MKKQLITALVVSLLGCSATFAEKVEFPIGSKTDTFNCLASDPTATVSIDTYSVDANGFCAGSPYVVRDGHIQYLPVSVLQNHYFQIRKDWQKKGSVEVTVSSGEVKCSTGKSQKPKAYGDGRYCLVAMY